MAYNLREHLTQGSNVPGCLTRCVLIWELLGQINMVQGRRSQSVSRHRTRSRAPQPRASPAAPVAGRTLPRLRTGTSCPWAVSVELAFVRAFLWAKSGAAAIRVRFWEDSTNAADVVCQIHPDDVDRLRRVL